MTSRWLCVCVYVRPTSEGYFNCPVVVINSNPDLAPKLFNQNIPCRRAINSMTTAVGIAQQLPHLQRHQKAAPTQRATGYRLHQKTLGLFFIFAPPTFSSSYMAIAIRWPSSISFLSKKKRKKRKERIHFGSTRQLIRPSVLTKPRNTT